MVEISFQGLLRAGEVKRRRLGIMVQSSRHLIIAMLRLLLFNKFTFTVERPRLLCFVLRHFICLSLEKVQVREELCLFAPIRDKELVRAKGMRFCWRL